MTIMRITLIMPFLTIIPFFVIPLQINAGNTSPIGVVIYFEKNYGSALMDGLPNTQHRN